MKYTQGILPRVDRISESKLHFAPFVRQQREIDKLLRQGRYRNVTDFMRQAIDHYLDRLGRPSLSEQARQMAQDFAQQAGPDDSVFQDASRASDERW